MPVVCATAAKFNVGHLPWQGFDGSFRAKREREREGWGKDGGGAHERLPRLAKGTRMSLRDSMIVLPHYAPLPMSEISSFLPAILRKSEANKP